MKYRVEVGSFCTRFIERHITVNAENEAEAGEKAIQKYCDMESNLKNASDVGTPQVDNIEEFTR